MALPVGDKLLILLNAHWESIDFILPAARTEHVWQLIFDTANPHTEPKTLKPGEHYSLLGRSMALLRTIDAQTANMPFSTPGDGNHVRTYLRIR